MLIVLASTSPARRAQLKSLGVRFQALAPKVDEEVLKKKLSSKSAKVQAMLLARAKAESLRDKYPKAVIIGGDQMVECEGVILGKPGARARAREQLKKMRGRTHHLITAIAVHWNGQTKAAVSVSRITLRHFTDREIERYLDLDQPYGSAGSYQFEKAGNLLMSSVDSKDPSGILGIPIITLNDLVEKVAGRTLLQISSRL